MTADEHYAMSIKPGVYNHTQLTDGTHVYHIRWHSRQDKAREAADLLSKHFGLATKDYVFDVCFDNTGGSPHYELRLLSNRPVNIYTVEFMLWTAGAGGTRTPEFGKHREDMLTGLTLDAHWLYGLELHMALWLIRTGVWKPHTLDAGTYFYAPQFLVKHFQNGTLDVDKLLHDYSTWGLSVVGDSYGLNRRETRLPRQDRVSRMKRALGLS